MEKILFGTYTTNQSKGIYQAQLDTDQKQLKNLELVTELGSPTYLAVNKQQNYLYAVDRQTDNGGVAAYSFNDGKASLINEYVSEGSSPAYLAVDNNRNLLYVAYYHRGSIEVYKINQDGSLDLTDTFINEGSGPRPEQDRARMHYVNLTPDNKIVAVDLGTDEVIFFDVSDDGKLNVINKFQAEKGFGARHIRFSPDGKLAYLLGELSSQLSVLNYNNNNLELIKTLSTIPDTWDKHNGAAALRISKDGKYIYASNRGHNSIAQFSTYQDLSLVDWFATEGDFPRDFNLSADDQFLVVANQNTNNVTLFERNRENGSLTLLQKDFPVPEAVSVKFLK
jgi:6-phosphogluconolactonase